MHGANTDELRQVGSIFGSAEGVLNQSASTLQSQIEGVDWLGPDADRFRSHWGQVIPNDLRAIAELTIDRDADLKRQADEQDKASSGNGGEGCLKSLGDAAAAIGNGVVDFFRGFFVDGIWEDLTALGALLGFDENGWSFETLKETWTGMGALLGFDSEGNWSPETLVNTWVAVGKDFLAWDQWATDPAGAAGRVLWNVGSMFIGVGEAKILAKAADAGRVANGATDAGRVADGAGTAGRTGDGASSSGRTGDGAPGDGRTGDGTASGDRTGDSAGGSSDGSSSAGRDADGSSRPADGGNSSGHPDSAGGASRAPEGSGEAGTAAGRAADGDAGSSSGRSPEGSSEAGTAARTSDGSPSAGEAPERAPDGASDAARTADNAGDAGRTADGATEAGRTADNAGDAARIADGSTEAAAAGRTADDASDAGRTADGDAATDVPLDQVDYSKKEPVGVQEYPTMHRDGWEGPDTFNRWNDGEGVSPDTVADGPPRVADDGRVTNFGPYDTGAVRLDDTRIQSTSGRIYDNSQVSHHWSSATTGEINYDLMLGSGPDGMPFEPNHRYVIDNGRMVIETNEFGAPIYERFIVDQTGAGDHFRKGLDGEGRLRDSTSVSNRDGTGNWGWGGLNQGLEAPTRGHSMGKQFGGGMEDILQLPQESHANSVVQKDLETDIANEFTANNRDMVVERRIDYDVLETPDGGRAIGPAREYKFDVSYLDDGTPVPSIKADKTGFKNTNQPN